MGAKKSKPVEAMVSLLAEKDSYVGLPLQLTAPVFASAGFTVRCISVKSADMYHPPNGRYNDSRVNILFDWISQEVSAIYVG